jgi:hypothetical protein
MIPIVIIGVCLIGGAAATITAYNRRAVARSLGGTWNSPAGEFEMTFALSQTGTVLRGSAELRGTVGSLDGSVEGTIASRGNLNLTIRGPAFEANFVGSVSAVGALRGVVHFADGPSHPILLHRETREIRGVHRPPTHSVDTGQPLESLTGGWSGTDGDEMQFALALEQHGLAIRGTAILTDTNGANINFDVDGTTGTTGFLLRLRCDGMMMELQGGPIATNRIMATVLHDPPVATPIMFFLTRDAL